MGTRASYWDTVLSHHSSPSTQAPTFPTQAGANIAGLGSVSQPCNALELPQLMPQKSLDEAGSCREEGLKYPEPSLPLASPSTLGAGVNTSSDLASILSPDMCMSTKRLPPCSIAGAVALQHPLNLELSSVPSPVSNETVHSYYDPRSGEGHGFGGSTESEKGREAAAEPGRAFRKFSCTFDGCGRSFERRGHLEEHVDSKHKNIQRFQCRVCSRSFSHKSSWRRHMSKMHDVVLHQKRNKKVH